MRRTWRMRTSPASPMEPDEETERSSLRKLVSEKREMSQIRISNASMRKQLMDALQEVGEGHNFQMDLELTSNTSNRGRKKFVRDRHLTDEDLAQEVVRKKMKGVPVEESWDGDGS